MKGAVRLGALAVTGVAACALAACGGTSGSQGASGSIDVEGSSTVQPITQAAAEAFQAENRGVRITVGGAGTGDGFEAFCSGKIQISDASRPIEQEEISRCRQNGVGFIEIPVATDGVSVVVNKQNGFAGTMTVDQLNRLWRPNSSFNRWNQLDPSWPNREISLYGPGTESGTFDFFTEYVNGEEGASRTDYQASEDDNVLVQGVAGDENALGYFGFSYYDQNKDKLKALDIDAGEGSVEPTKATIRSGEYPLSRPLFIYVSKKAVQNNDAVGAFVEFYISEQNLNQIVEVADYVPLDRGTADAARQQFEDRTTGTVYDENGSLPGGDLEAALKESR